ncbi:fimbrial protein [Dyella tabacisoli]|uniref:Type 1 fimbrial protein n=1 Tax=Dyella tabacisoli TaxID=2282381 RepID=A0A369UT79_9GAMM|nr:type 1 fimbrial protein [Dyella tabacisoli]RDD81549.1 type 1 fimbrial protein [Dyella tabacisoli]
MKASLRFIVPLACLSLASAAFATSGSISFSGLVAEPTCRVSSHHGDADRARHLPVTITVSSCVGTSGKLRTWFGSVDNGDLTSRMRKKLDQDHASHAPAIVRTRHGRLVDFQEQHVIHLDPTTGKATHEYVADHGIADAATSSATYTIAYD